ncbi:hypothetical protein Bhyg_12482 [Pseudolycoriella hygida]|uniref:Transmembrane protein 59 n=1 Tax=Pseudolycoriella hygida TaxID=35572 RepID=A0A9Q0RZC3_9DIPT|nr:hypothetical protein Bhyg_12482 [Pseudolycoriella hygida]
MNNSSALSELKKVLGLKVSVVPKVVSTKMFTKFGISFILATIGLQQIDPITCLPNPSDLQQGFTTRCDELCSNEIQEDLRPDCQRGCQYYNIEFLVSASNKNKVTDLETTHHQCRSSCSEAYTSRLKSQNACEVGCGKMNDLQSKAPYINGWLVYMGAPDHSMVLLQPDLDIISDDDDWVLLDSVLRNNNNNDYDKIFEQYKMTETRIQTIPVHECKRRFSLDFSWIWILLVLTLMFVTMHILQRYGFNHFNEQLNEKILNDNVCKTFHPNDDFVVSNDSYFYPTPVIPPPKYNEVIEAMLLTDEEECNVSNEMKSAMDRK